MRKRSAGQEVERNRTSGIPKRPGNSQDNEQQRGLGHMYEVVEHRERRDRPGTAPEQRLLGRFESAAEALVQGRVAWKAFEASGSDDYAWWVVKRDGAELAEWIADSRSSKEYVVDLTSGQLVEIP